MGYVSLRVRRPARARYLDRAMPSYTTERILEVRHWNDHLFSFSTTRSPGFRFESGQFVMLAIDPGEGRLISRAYSIASANYQERLEFYSIKVPGGAFTSRLKCAQPGDSLMISTKPTGTLVTRDLKPGRRLFLLATGTGVAPFLSLVRDPETYEHFEQIFLVRGAAQISDLAYARSVLDALEGDPYLGDMARTQLRDYPAVTRENFRHRGRLSTLLESDELFNALEVTPLDSAEDRVMICGNIDMVADLGRILDAKGLKGSPGIGIPGDYVVERAFVESTATSKTPNRQTAKIA